MRSGECFPQPVADVLVRGWVEQDPVYLRVLCMSGRQLLVGRLEGAGGVNPARAHLHRGSDSTSQEVRFPALSGRPCLSPDHALPRRRAFGDSR